MFMAWIIVPCLAVASWPQFRGQHADGHAPEVSSPLEWSETQHVRWKVPVAGLGWSSPVVVDDQVYITTAVPQGDGLSLRAIALHTATGQVVWDQEVRQIPQAPAIHAKNSHASPTPIVHDDAVYVHFGALGMARLAKRDGAIAWLCTALDYPPVHGSGGSPVLQDGKLVVVCDGSTDPFVAAVSADNGKVLWRASRSVKGKISHSFVTPAIAFVNGSAQVLAPGPDHMAAYDLETGAEIWRARALGWSVVPQPVIGHGLVIYNHDYDNPELLAVRLGGQGDVTDTHIAWRVKRGAPSTPTPLLLRNDLYCISDSGIATCLDARDGKQHWMKRLGGNYSASPLYVQGRILFLSENGLATWVQPGREYVELGTNEVPGRTLATPAFVGNSMYLRTDSHLYRFCAE